MRLFRFVRVLSDWRLAPPDFRIPEHDAHLAVELDGRTLDLTAGPGRIDTFEALLSRARRASGTPLAAALANEVRKAADGAPELTFTLADLEGGEYDGVRLVLPWRPEEVWACGVTYERSRQARVEEARVKDVYTLVYEAERPELFFKATGARLRGPGDGLAVRRDSKWMVPEPELTLVVGRQGELLGFTVGNDQSSRDIEGENPLYLPQAKMFWGSAAIGPAVALTAGVPDPYALDIVCRIMRDGQEAFVGRANTRQLKRRFEELIGYLQRDNDVPEATALMTGTCIVPPDEFSLQVGDTVEIEIAGVGRLRNPIVAR
ncbi:MAG TPA: fumarylacetoacetate hydrolase family protein [Limnochordia bacterium]|nr:fumarylacetoacetate hydrolase family protein [Limnochordia bacterium]